ncbi:MAG: SpaH/EbpB family LPXTG-anchored major pilin, partial [Ruminococcus sp.]|nr:SpaH/EbpB family LPXTG-anchored major pilin [Ruminococcus sp.]
NYGDFKTDSNGNIDFGTLRVYNSNNAKIQYTVKELGLKNNDGTYTIPYKYNSVDDVTFTLTADETYTVTFKNTLKTGSVTLYKQDGLGVGLVGAEFELYNSQGELLKVKENEIGNYSFTTDDDGITTVVTDSNGKIVVENMPQDKGYYFIETKSPAGKMPYANKISFDIIADSETTLNPELIVKDNNIVMLGTGSIGDIGFGGTASVLAIVAVAFIVLHFTKNRKRKEKVKMQKKHFGAKLLTAMLMTILIVFSSISVVGAAEVNNGRSGTNILDKDRKVSFTLNCEKKGYTFDIFQVGRLENFETPYETKYTSLVSEIDDSILNGDTATMLSELDKVTVLPDEATKVGTFITSEQSSQTISDLEQGIFYVRAVNYPAGVKSVTNSVFALPYYSDSWIYDIPDINIAEKVNDDIPETHKSITNSTKNNENFTDVSLGDRVDFQIKSTTAGSNQMKLKAYVVSDDMSPGLTLDKNSFKVSLLDENSELITELPQNDFKVTVISEGEGKNTVFSVELTYDYLQKSDFYSAMFTSVTYSATLNKYAVVGADGNPNTETALKYTNKNDVSAEIDGNTVYVYTYGIYVDKFNENAEALPGAEFALYKTKEDAENGRNAIATGTSDSKGKVYFYNTNNEEIRLQSGPYFIKETEAPEGFNPYTDVIEITIDVTYGDTFVNGTYVTGAPINGYASIEVKNTKTVLPQSGGYGNIILYIVATIVLVGSITLFAIRRKIK